MNATHLTPSGAGLWLDSGCLSERDLTGRLQASLDERRFVVLRGVLPTREDAVALLRTFGPINEADTRKDGAVMVEERDDEVFRSNEALPLHKDGLLTGFDVMLAGIFCVEFSDVTNGRTYVSDANEALRELAPEDVLVLRENGVEAMAVDATGYYRAEYEATWHHFPAFRAAPGRAPTLNLGLPHGPGESESWRVRVAGVSPSESDRILAALRAALLDERYVYYHDWQPGDLLLMDNYAVLHGREAFQARARRLANIQVLRQPASA